MRNLCDLDPDEFEALSDEEMDEYYRRKKTNSRKSLLPLFIYLILQKHSSPSHPLQQNDIIRLLAAYPYEIQVERKAVSRALHGLEDSLLGIHSEPRVGVWMRY